MINVFIPDWMMKTVKRITNSEGYYNDFGKWIPGQEIQTDIKCFYAFFGSKEIKDYPQGLIEIGDMDIRTKTKLEKGDIIDIDNERWKIMDRIDYSYLADIKFYIGKRSDKDG